MAKPVKRNKAAVVRLDMTNLEKGVYFNENSFGVIHTMNPHDGVSGKEYVFSGKIHNGECSFMVIDQSVSTFPSYDGYDHGFTLEGVAQSIFKVEGALCNYNAMEKRTFCYSKKDSKLTFVGDAKKDYTLYVRFYDNNRWAVIYAE